MLLYRLRAPAICFPACTAVLIGTRAGTNVDATGRTLPATLTTLPKALPILNFGSGPEVLKLMGSTATELLISIIIM
jgi:hypothetical protein